MKSLQMQNFHDSYLSMRMKEIDVWHKGTRSKKKPNNVHSKVWWELKETKCEATCSIKDLKWEKYVKSNQWSIKNQHKKW
jgi:hypothetical protein